MLRFFLKKQDEKGFTLIELLASMVILGIILAVAIPNVTGILNQSKNSTYVEDTKKLLTLGKYKFRGDNSLKIADKSCLIMDLNYLDNSEFDNPPNGGNYLWGNSFVVIQKKGNQYLYYVQLVESLKNGNSYRGVPLVSSDQLTSGKASSLVQNVALADINQSVVSESDFSNSASPSPSSSSKPASPSPSGSSKPASPSPSGSSYAKSSLRYRATDNQLKDYIQSKVGISCEGIIRAGS